MELSILTSTKKILGLAEDYTAFDLDVITHINSAFATLQQLGIGPLAGFTIDDSTAEWTDFIPEPELQHILNLAKQYVFLKVSIVFDPPQIGYLIDLKKNQIAEHEFRLTVAREEVLNAAEPTP